MESQINGHVDVSLAFEDSGGQQPAVQLLRATGNGSGGVRWETRTAGPGATASLTPLWVDAHVGRPVEVAAGPAGVAVATSGFLSLRDADSGAVRASVPLQAGLMTAFSYGGSLEGSISVATAGVALLTGRSDLTVYAPTLSRRLAWHYEIRPDRGRSS